jgi:hypothetical protein
MRGFLNLIEWLLIRKYLSFKDAAERFQEEAGISADMDLSLLDNRIKIRDYIQVF